MEEDHHHHQEYKHACKFCDKRFPCGRSLGGHMRSHLTNNSGDTQNTICRKKLKSVKNGGSCNMVTQGVAAAGYGLREHPKKTWRIADSSEETSAQDKLCKECGKGFVSWKALFGHMKCHSDKDRVSNNMSLEIQDSWKLVMDSQSDNETTVVPHRRRRRSRRTRCMTIAATTSSSAVSEIEQEQEEVAICLMMLSRDVGHWDGLNFAAESSDNNCMLLEAQFSLQSSKITGIESKNSVCNGTEIMKSNKLSDKKLEPGNRSEMNINEVYEDFEVELGKNLIKESDIDTGSGEFNLIKKKFSDSIVKFKKLSDRKLQPGKFEGRKSRNGSEMNTNEVFEDSEVVELGKSLIKESEIDQVQQSSRKYNSIKRKFDDPNDPDQLRLGSLKKLTDAADSEISSKFECTTCNKVFHSYQALGGHRASHKKIRKGSKFDTIENSIENEIYPNSAAAAARKLPDPFNNDNPIDHEMHSGFDEKPETSCVSKKRKGHECPICLKVFPSGQALGGHKRSHFVGASEARNNQDVLIEKPVPEIRNLLDLNLPAPVEEESNGNLGLRPWWIGGSHKHEAIVGLISN